MFMGALIAHPSSGKTTINNRILNKIKEIRAFLSIPVQFSTYTINPKNFHILIVLNSFK